MVELKDLPNELLYGILSLLHSIDDVQSIACCSKWLNDWVNAERLRLYRSIITHSDTHQFDVRLCHLIETNAQCFAVKDSIYLDPRTPKDTVLMQCLDADVLTDQQIWDIAARWTGLRCFAGLYENPDVRRIYSDSTCWTPQPEMFEIKLPDATVDFVQTLGAHWEEGEVDRRATNLDYSRFYAALTGLWLTLEAVKLCFNTETELVSRTNDLCEAVSKLWANQNDLRARLEGIELYDLLYNFIVPRLPCFSIEQFQDWMPSDNTLYNETIEFRWQIFMSRMPMHLNPADILDLIRDPRHGLSRTWKQEFFLSRGYGDMREWETTKVWDAEGEA